MKLVLMLFMVESLFAFPVFAAEYDSQKKNNQDMVSSQKKNDQKRKDEIIKKMRVYMGELNSRLKTNPEVKTEIITPVKTDDITDIKKTEDIHTKKNVPASIYGYAKNDNLKLFTAPGEKKEVGMLKFAEKIEILMKSEITINADLNSGNYLLIRRNDSSEGWIEEFYISDVLPTVKLINADNPKIVDSKHSFSVPVAGSRTSNFGMRVHPISKKTGNFHSGVDIAAPLGTPVYAAADGSVVIAEFKKNGYGNLIVIKHETDLSTYYGHLSKIAVAPGVQVKKGQYIGNIGSTGASTGPHLHFEVRKSDKAMNPDDFLR